MYSAELEKLKREKDEWRRRAQQLEDQASGLQVKQPSALRCVRAADPIIPILSESRLALRRLCVCPSDEPG